jgi:hypothetical protein
VSKSGYEVFVGPGATLTPATVTTKLCTFTAGALSDAVPTYYATATPNQVGSTGQRSFGTDQRATIYADSTGAAFTLVSVTAATNAIQ